MIGQDPGLQAAAADIVLGQGGIRRFDPDRPVGQIDESPAAPVSG
jgi:hypothetical protein